MTGAAHPLLSQPEGKTLEFKRDLSSPQNALKTLVAFANSAGGRLVIGVDDARQVLGVANPLAEEERICNLIADAIAPRLIPNVELMSLDGATVLIVEVFPSSARPHYFARQGLDRGTYLRLGSSNRQAGPDWIAEARRAAAGLVFDEQPMPELTAQDLDVQALARWLGPRRPLDDKALQTLKLLRPHHGRLVPTRGAVLLWGRQRELHFPDAWVQCERFRGADKVHIFDQQEIHAPLPDALTDIELFLKKHAYKAARFGSLQREDLWSIPLTLLREAIVNALVHADYAQRGTPIRIAFFDDRIDIESPGFLLPGMTVQDMRSGVSRIRNPVIARMFRELGLVEQWGSGVRRIFAEAAQLGLPPPVLAEIATGVRLSVALAQPHAAGAGAPRATTNTTTAPATAPEEASRLESKLAARIFVLLLARESGKAALAQSLGHRSVSGELHKQIGRLLERGLIAMTLPEKPTSRLQRYRLTPRGQALAAELLTPEHPTP
ncbi:AAA family ATPase [Melaminivora suipulveris]|uniref:AAA family ATPase n=1 Tax=Melaminivora suipulveris TaxID=2109913 RepID=A0A2R3QBT2_9BURK|nr:helix-turn-helix domain-containing protein [Melaminivora suipulveris]AVO49248.1 AAA family ATPase [Melaminivora suipulveris]